MQPEETHLVIPVSGSSATTDSGLLPAHCGFNYSPANGHRSLTYPKLIVGSPTQAGSNEVSSGDPLVLPIQNNETIAGVRFAPSGLCLPGAGVRFAQSGLLSAR